MRDRNLERILAQIDGRGYVSYRQLAGTHRIGAFRLAIDHIQIDPYAPPSRMRVILDRETAGFPGELTCDDAGRIAVSDFMTRRFHQAARRIVPQQSGTGNSGVISIGHPGQEVLERTSVLIAPDRVEARIEVGLPARGRQIRGREAARLLTELLPRIAEASLIHANLDQRALDEHVVLLRDQEHLRRSLPGRGLVAFVGDGAILPRLSGDSDLPLKTSDAVPFTAPETLRVRFDLPSGRTVSGMGIAEGITVIVGGGYHGKSTLLRAIERGVYPHIGGDGREWVITRPDAVTVRAEDGRAVTDVDISPFITNLPSGSDTRSFTTTNASGSTSQAANLVEALEAGASTLLIDEDTSATNFMIRDARMRALIPADKEPITPFVDRIRPLFAVRGASTILVAGGSGAFFDVADHVIALDHYRPRDVTAQAHDLATGRRKTSPGAVFSASSSRILARSSLHPPGKRKPAKAQGRAGIRYGEATIDLASVPQLVDLAQTQAIAHAMDRLADLLDDQMSLPEAVTALEQRIDAEGLDWLSPHRGHPGQLARPRRYEIQAAVNRYRDLRPARKR